MRKIAVFFIAFIVAGCSTAPQPTPQPKGYRDGIWEQCLSDQLGTINRNPPTQDDAEKYCNKALAQSDSEGWQENQVMIDFFATAMPEIVNSTMSTAEKLYYRAAYEQLFADGVKSGLSDKLLVEFCADELNATIAHDQFNSTAFPPLPDVNPQG